LAKIWTKVSKVPRFLWPTLYNGDKSCTKIAEYNVIYLQGDFVLFYWNRKLKAANRRATMKCNDA